ncbi:MAG: PEP-CTERM sorting domain-containing protein [Planctomycetota bacterium]
MSFRPIASLAAVGLALAAGSPAAAQSSAGHVDISVYDNGAGQVETGFYDFDTQSFLLDQRLFTEPLELIESSFHAVGAPGFYSDASLPLPSGAIVDFDVPAVDHPFNSSYANAPYTVDVHNLLYWDGIDDDNDGDKLDDVDFSTPPAGTTLVVFDNPFPGGSVSVDGSSSPVTGFPVGLANASGGVHEHVAFRVLGPGGSTPDDGVFVLPITIGATGLADSETIYLQFNGVYQRDTNGDIIYNGFLALTDLAAEAAAQQWVEDYLLRELGDFNDSDDLDLNDLEQLIAQKGLADPAFGFDLTGDALVTDDDIDRWILELAGTVFGDYNIDGVVDGADYTFWANRFGGTSPNDLLADGNRDGVVDGADYTFWANRFGDAGGLTFDEVLATFDPAVVPEPASALLIALVGGLALARRRRDVGN